MVGRTLRTMRRLIVGMTSAFLNASEYSAVTLADCTDDKAQRLPPSVRLLSLPITLGVRVGATYMLADQSSALRRSAFVSFSWSAPCSQQMSIRIKIKASARQMAA